MAKSNLAGRKILLAGVIFKGWNVELLSSKAKKRKSLIASVDSLSMWRHCPKLLPLRNHRKVVAELLHCASPCFFNQPYGCL